ncbi:hypothetical protein BBJ28_00000977 [Nothophytophthora sp. Chile5]|nr:hypothetical protein BBJ28_00000977 [Nothophytophthora sp. Chile5]
MRRGAPPTYDAMGAHPTYKSATPTNAGSGATTPRSQRSTTTTPRSQRSGSASSNGTILVNLDVFIHRATIGRDISPVDEDLIVLFRRNSKEITSEPTRWRADHVAVWNQHVGIQTSLLRHKKASSSGAEFLKKEYEVVLVAPAANPTGRQKSFRISPLKCRDLAATLELDITWDYVHAATATVSATATATASVPGMLLHATHNPHTTLAGLPPSSTLLKPQNQAAKAQNQTPKSQNPNLKPQIAPPPRRAGTDTPASSLSSRRTTASMSSQGSERELLEELAGTSGGCATCRSAKRRLERKDVQVLQLESFLKESQKRIDSLAGEAEELAARERAETRNASHHRVLSLRLLQELETAFQFCASQIQPTAAAGSDAFVFLPQFEFMERVKRFHDELNGDGRGGSDADSEPTPTPSALAAFDFRAETGAALQRNLRLQQQLEFLDRSLAYDSDAQLQEDATRSQRAATDASGTTVSSAKSSVDVDGDASRPVALTMTQQLNNLERENFRLKAQLEDALLAAASGLKKSAGGYLSSLSPGSLAPEVSETTSSSSREELEEPEQEDAALLGRIHEQEARGRSKALEAELQAAQRELQQLQQRLDASEEQKTPPQSSQQAPGFLDKIYADVGKAKLVLEERVKQLNAHLADATEENARLRVELETLQHQKEPSDDSEANERLAELQTLLQTREQQLQTHEAALATAQRQLEAAEARATTSERGTRAVETELASVRRSLQQAQEAVKQLEKQAATLSAEAPAVSTASATSHLSESGANVHAQELADAQKQLKLSKQEAMQLRYRSNQLESVHERLEDALKEKRTLEVKLTALEGQLYEHRSRTISDNSFTSAALDAKNATLFAEMQRELDQKTAQLLMAQRELKERQAGGRGEAPGNLEDVADKVLRFENEVARLCQRNEEQAKRLEKLGARVTVAVRERDELEVIVKQMMAEMALLDPTAAVASLPRSRRTPSIPEADETEEKVATASSSLARRASPPPAVQTGKISDRYANAVASRSARQTTSPASASPPTSTKSSKVAQLMKNFSTADDSSGDSGGMTFKRPTKLDFRSRQGSAASQRSTDSKGESPAARLRRAPSAAGAQRA